MFEDISYKVYGRYMTGFIWAGYEWSDLDEAGTIDLRPKLWALSAPGKRRVRYIPGFRFWQMIGLIPRADR